MKKMNTAPAVAITAVSMVLTLAVVVSWLGSVMPWPVALVVGLGLDGAWLATLSYERRLARQGDHSATVTGTGWGFGLVATGVLVAHALNESSPAAWLAVSWLPIAAKALWLVHGLWERTALTPRALKEISEIRQSARDEAAVARAQLGAQAGTEETRLMAVTSAGARVARVQERTARTLSRAWDGLQAVREEDSAHRALTSVTTPVTPRWELPVWGPTSPALLPADTEDQTLSDQWLDEIVSRLCRAETPPPSYRELAVRFRAEGHSASETRLRAAWKRVSTQTTVG